MGEGGEREGRGRGEGEGGVGSKCVYVSHNEGMFDQNLP